METKHQVAVIGGGWHAQANLLPALALAGVEVVDLATRDLGRAQTALGAARSGGRAWDDAAQMLAHTAAERVLVVAQPGDQPALVVQALEAGKDVLVEKPLGRTVAEAREIERLAEAHGRRVVVGFMKRYAPAYLRLRELVAAGELGEVRAVRLSFGCDARGFCTDLADVVHLAAIHQVDLLRSLFGEVQDVSSVSSGAGADVTLAATMRQGSATVGLDVWSTAAFSAETERLEVVGDRGTATVVDMHEVRLRTASPSTTPGWRDVGEVERVYTSAHSAMAGTERDLFLGGLVGQVADFAASGGAIGGAADAADNVLTMELCERLIRGR